MTMPEPQPLGVLVEGKLSTLHRPLSADPKEQKRRLVARIEAVVGDRKMNAAIPRIAADLVVFHAVPLADLEHILVDVECLREAGTLRSAGAFFLGQARQQLALLTRKTVARSQGERRGPRSVRTPISFDFPFLIFLSISEDLLWLQKAKNRRNRPPASRRPAKKAAAKLSGCRYLETVTIGLDVIVPSPYQPREQIDDAALQSLADAIRHHGFLDAIWVRRGTPHDGRYYMAVRDAAAASSMASVAGERRRLRVPAASAADVFEATDAQARQMALLSVVHRRGPLADRGARRPTKPCSRRAITPTRRLSRRRWASSNRPSRTSCGS